MRLIQFINETPESDDVFKIDNAIKEQLGKRSDIQLDVGKRTVLAAGARIIPGHNKADMYIVNSKGQPTAFISLKHGSGPISIHQWGGISFPPMRDNPNVIKFAKRVRQLFPDGFPVGKGVGRRINDDLLKNQTVFGKDFGGAPGINNVDLVLQGFTKLQQIGNKFTLVGEFLWPNGDTPTGPHEPVLMARWSGDRSNFGIKNARFSLYSAGGRAWQPI